MSDLPLHLLRPGWLLALVPLLLLYACLRRRRHSGHSVWLDLVDPALQPYVIVGEQASKAQVVPLQALLWGWILAAILLSGPVWERQQVEAGDLRASEVLVQDLSLSMSLEDVRPSRVDLTIFRLRDLLGAADDMRIGLVAFAERPYVISPLSDDKATLAGLLPSLRPDVMPVQGSQPELAIAEAVQLLAQAGVQAGHVVLLTDTVVEESLRDAVRALRQAGHRLSVIGVGSGDNVPLRSADGRFLNDLNGKPQTVRFDREGLVALAREGGGAYADANGGRAALDAVLAVRTKLSLDALSVLPVNGDEAAPSGDPADAVPVTAPTVEYWVEYGPWLLPLLLLGTLTLFRRERPRVSEEAE